MAALPEPSSQTVQAIYAAYEAKQETGFRYHLGASLIGDECERSLWYTFRWTTRASFEGRLLRLFDTGNKEEARFIDDLRSIGVEVWDEDPEKPGKQIGVRDEFGHFGGSLDGMGLGIPEAPKTWHVLEYKTHGEKSFKLLVKDKLQKAKPLHWAQVQVYMHLIGATRGLYLAKNKNTDELYSERVEYDVTFALKLMAKADRVIKSPHAPQRISENPAWFQCRFCNHHAVCHGDKVPERNCRTCINSTPVQGGLWQCSMDYAYLTREQQEEGCSFHRYIPDFIHGTQTDATEATPGNWLITYVLKTGDTWVDGYSSQGDGESGIDASYDKTGAPF